MNEKGIILGGIVGAILLTGLVSVATGTPAMLGQTPTGAAIYLLVGVAAPQLLLGRRADDPMRTGLGALAGIAGIGVFVEGRFVGTPNAISGFANILTVLVLGAILGIAVQEFWRGYARRGNRND